MPKPCCFFDRDGIVNEPPVAARYVRTPAEFRIVPDFLNVLALVLRKGYEAVIVTNQKGVATGVMTREDVDQIHAVLQQAVQQAGLRLLDILVCTAADDSDPRRKPNPGMLLEAAARHDLDLPRSWMIGDNEKDIEAGRRAGCRTILVNAAETPTVADFKVGSVKQLLQLLENILPPGPMFDGGCASC
jgi:D-glycero-D-manno-heptose 1,7-bisphosphate phosphatase